jgi:hypothetical protein
MIELKPNFYEEEVLDDLHPKMRSLPISQQAMVENRVRSLANQIMTQLQQMLLTGTSTPIIKMSAVTLFSQLKVNAERMLDENKHHEQSRVEDAKYFEEFAQRVQGLTIDTLTPPKQPQSRAFDSVVESVRNTQKANIQEHIAVARGLAAGIELIGKTAVDGVCNANPINRFACDMAAEGFQSVSNCFDYEPTALPHVLESQYGIPQKVGKQFARDGITVGAAVLPFPPVARFAKFLPGLNAVRIPSSLGRTVVHFLKDESGFIRMPKEFIPQGIKRPELVIAKDFSEVHSLVTAQRVNALKKPWAHEPLLNVVEDKVKQDLAADAAGVLKKYSWKELEHKTLHIHEGHAYQGASKIPLQSEVEMNYVMFRDGTIRIDFKQVGKMWSFHSSLVRGEGPIAAGEMKILRGRVSYLNEHSGHFLPTNRVQYVEHELKARGAFFTDDFKMHVADDLMLKIK